MSDDSQLTVDESFFWGKIEFIGDIDLQLRGTRRSAASDFFGLGPTRHFIGSEHNTFTQMSVLASVCHAWNTGPTLKR